jgi:hypothetical protein
MQDTASLLSFTGKKYIFVKPIQCKRKYNRSRYVIVRYVILLHAVFDRNFRFRSHLSEWRAQ